MATFNNESDNNPYATPAAVQSESMRSLQPVVSLLLLCAAVFVIGWPATLPPLRSVLPIPISNQRLWCVLYFAPVVHWELVCRTTPRPPTKRSSVLSSVCRIVLMYFPATMALHVGLCFIYMNSPAATQWTIQPRSILAASIFLAGLCFVRYDCLRARKHLRQGDPASRSVEVKA